MNKKISKQQMQNYNRYDCFYFISLLSETCRVPGWFGPDCVYKCHCQQTLCDGASGECTEGTRCEDGYTGTSCQYSMFFYPPVPSLYISGWLVSAMASSSYVSESILLFQSSFISSSFFLLHQLNYQQESSL